MTRQSYFTPCSTNHHSSCLQPGRLFCLWCPWRQTGSRHDMRTSLLKKRTDKHAAHLWNRSGEGSEMSMLSQPRGFCFTGSCSYQVYCRSRHTHWIPLVQMLSLCRPKIMEVTMALLLTCIAPCRLQHRHRCLKLQMDGILGLRWYWMYWYTSTWMNRHICLLGPGVTKCLSYSQCDSMFAEY